MFSTFEHISSVIMKTEFEIGQEVWVIYNSRPRKGEVFNIVISEEGICYAIGLFGNRYEDQIGATKEELKDKIFK